MGTCKTVTYKQLMSEYGATEEEVAEIKALAEAAERGEWPEGETVSVGRPRTLEEDSKVITFRLSAAKADAVERRAAEQGKTRSDALREAVDDWLMQA